MLDCSELRGMIFTEHGNLTDVQSGWATYTYSHTNRKHIPLPITAGKYLHVRLELQYSTDC